jgi:hypothetical protein
MSEIEIIAVLVAVLLIAVTYLLFVVQTLRRQLERIEKEVNDKASKYRLEAYTSKLWDHDHKLEALAKHLKVEIKCSTPQWEVKRK